MAALDYHPSEQYLYQSLHSRTRHEPQTQPKVPEGFPQHLDSPLAWTRAEVESKRSEWMLELGQEEIAAIDRALVVFEGKHLRTKCIVSSSESFPV